jgi:hypothetical protein
VPRHEGVLGKWRYSSTHSLTSALDGGEWSASRPGRFTSRERAHGTIGKEAGWASGCEFNMATSVQTRRKVYEWVEKCMQLTVTCVEVKE